MASNAFPQNSGLLYQLGGKMETGITEVGASVPVTMTTAKQMHDDTQSFKKADDDFNAGRSAEQNASNAFQATVEPLYTWLLSVKNVLTSRFGTRWNTQWAQAGFTNRTTAIPTPTPARITLGSRLVEFFTKNPTFEVPSMGLTAAAGAALVKATQDAQGILSKATAAQKVVSDAWTTAYNKLIKTMTQLLKNLEGNLNKDDTRWLAFGLQIPATITTPAQPVNVVAHMDGMGALVAGCDAVPTAARYRFRMMILGIETEYNLVASATEPLATIKKNVLPGQTVQIIVQAVSGNLQSVPSEPIVFTVPFIAKPTAPVTEASRPAEDGMPASAAGNGHPNGNRLPALS